MAAAKPKARKKPKKSTGVVKLLEAVKAGELAPVYYFYASEKPIRGPDRGKGSPYNDYLLDRALDGIKQLVVDGNTKDFNYDSFIGGEAKMADVMAIAQTYPMMRDKRLVIVKDAHEFRAEDWKAAAGFMADPAPSTCLVFVGAHFPTRSKGGDAARALILEHAACTSFAPFKRDKDVYPYLRAEIQLRNLKLEGRALSVLVELIGRDLNELILAIEKLELFTADKGAIGYKDVQTCIAGTRAEEVWGLLDALSERKLGPALKHMRAYIENAKPDDEILLVGQLISLFKKLVRLRRKLDQGASPSKVISEGIGHPYRLQKEVERVRRISSRQLALTMNALYECDRAIRSSRVPNHSHFERFVMRACGMVKGYNGS